MNAPNAIPEEQLQKQDRCQPHFFRAKGLANVRAWMKASGEYERRAKEFQKKLAESLGLP